MVEPSAEELRRRLYRAGAGDADVAAFRAALRPGDRATPGRPAEDVRRPPGRRALLLGVPVVVAGAALAAAPLLRPARRDAAPIAAEPLSVPMVQVDLGVVGARLLDVSSRSWSADAAHRARGDLEASLLEHAYPAVASMERAGSVGGEEEGDPFDQDLRGFSLRAGDTFALSVLSRGNAYVRGRLEGRTGGRRRVVVRFGRVPAVGGRMALGTGTIPAATVLTRLRLELVPRTRYQVRLDFLRRAG